ncbi:hypothetical protein KY342_00575 [Candidatus Woesearchaeota archaeon]|nr:hypothetical protein [Candidatus Woesearchaeota archaeon]
MEEGLIKITPNKEKAKSILKMVENTLDMIRIIDVSKFSSNITKEYYEIIRELISIVLLLDGYKTIGEGAHKKLIEYLESNYNQFGNYEILLIDDLRKIRNKIAYDGFFVKEEYIQRNLEDIQKIISKLKEIISKRIYKLD